MTKPPDTSLKIPPMLLMCFNPGEQTQVRISLYDQFNNDESHAAP